MFKESQKFDQWWLQLMFYSGIGLCIYVSVQQLLYKIPFGNNPAPDGLLIFFILLYLIIFILFQSTRLITEIDDREIRYRFYPFQTRFKTILRSDIEKMEVITYRPIIDYGGWGVRFGRKGMAYNVSGNIGLLISRKNGKTILIGTQKPDEMKEKLEGKRD
jgi:hypothetical protein